MAVCRVQRGETEDFTGLPCRCQGKNTLYRIKERFMRIKERFMWHGMVKDVIDLVS